MGLTAFTYDLLHFFVVVLGQLVMFGCAFILVLSCFDAIVSFAKVVRNSGGD